MRSKKRLAGLAVAGLAMAGFGTLGVAGPASADTLAPSCIIAHTYANGDVVVNNHCANTKRIKVVMAWGPDLNCTTIPASGGARWSDPLGRLDKVVLC